MRTRIVLAALIAIGSAVLAAQPASAATAPYIVVLKPTGDVNSAVTKAKGVGATVAFTYKSALRGYSANIPTDKVTTIAADPSVAYVTADKQMALPGKPQPCKDPQVCQMLPPGIDRIDADASSARAGDGRGSVPTNIAIIDTGIQPNHPDLNVVGGKVCVPGVTNFGDYIGHGTHVAGTAAAKDDGAGVVGAAPGARLWSARVFNKADFTAWSWLICAVDWVASTRSDADPSNDIHVANMSLGGKGSDDGACGTVNRDPFHASICAATAAGVLFVVSAGNDRSDLAAGAPGAYDEVLTVTSMNDYDGTPGGTGLPSQNSPACDAELSAALDRYPDDAGSEFSDTARVTDAAHTIAAPGLCVLSTLPGNSYGTMHGTSMASPHVTGTMALCIASGPCQGLTPAQMIQKVRGDSAAYSAANPAFGFTGDLVRPYGDGRIFGPLVRTALY
jgi:subtilisin family serine protease